jgi:3-hydroxyisobutyrate dehydrogenase and related beta-hydroxyacid dehydrogenases
MTENIKIGFIGLGTMGGAIARCLINKGYSLNVFDQNTEALAKMTAKGGKGLSSIAEVLKRSSIIFTSLPTPEVVKAVWTQNIDEVQTGTLIVDTSTVDPATARHLSNQIDAKNAQFVAATVGKTPLHAETGDVPFFIGGETSAKSKILPILSDISSDIFDMGSVEGATIFKLISNLVGMTGLVALAEGYAMANAEGINGEVFAAALKTTGAWSLQADMRLPDMINESFTTKFAVDLAAKDIRLSIDAAARIGVPAPTASAALAAYLQTSAMGHGTEDASAVLHAIRPFGTE